MKQHILLLSAISTLFSGQVFAKDKEVNFISTDPAKMQGKKIVKSNCTDLNVCSPYIYKLKDPFTKTVTYTDKDMSDDIFYVKEKTINLNDEDSSKVTEFRK